MRAAAKACRQLLDMETEQLEMFQRFVCLRCFKKLIFTACLTPAGFVDDKKEGAKTKELRLVHLSLEQSSFTETSLSGHFI